METTPTDITQEKQENIHITVSDHFIEWLQTHDISLIFSSYQLGKFFLIGRHPPSGLSIFQRNFIRCMGIAVDPIHDVIYLSTLHQIWKFKNCLNPGDDYTGYDRLYSPQACYFTGQTDIHDMVLTKNGELVYVNTLFSCLAKLNEFNNFEPLWKPPFITKLAPEDRCHLNGLALQEGEPRYVSYFSQTNSPHGWRHHKQEGGGIFDITSNEIMCDGLSMPHSPRVYKNKLWILNSGTGHLGYVDPLTRQFQEVAFLPGYLRGLQFIEDYAIVGLSHLREKSIIATHQLEENIKKHDKTPQCGIYIIHCQTGAIVHQLELSGSLAEIYDIALLPHIKKPMAIGIEGDHIQRIVSVSQKNNIMHSPAFFVLDNLT
jgi:uncharacterized protein (TIGR03032 family)